MEDINIAIYKLPELLAPAGSMEALKAAVENGANAVYLGGRLFNARQYAGNFDNNELEKAIDFSHIRDVKVYLTMNTLVSDNEMREALTFVGQAYNMGIDAIIIQDLGLASIIKDKFPKLNLHASTQMTIYNAEGVDFLNKMGFKRVVLARELSLREIRSITQSCNTEIEMFIHGALCISYSGQCLMSSILGGRSGNRGKCAQPCRLPYQLIKSGNKTKDSKACDNKAYILSPKDICTITELEEIINAGVKSLKIEGRMKSPEYVATVVRTYRKYLDKTLETMDLNCSNNIESKEIESDGTPVAEEDMKNLYQIFNRGGFSKGYLFGKTGADMMSIEKPKNWGVYIGKVIYYDNKTKTIKTELEDNLAIGDGIEVWSKGDGESPGTIVSEIIKNKINIKEAIAGDIVTIGHVSGSINSGNKIYKTSDKKLIEAARETWTQGFRKKIAISGELHIKTGEVPVFIVNDNNGNKIEIKGEYIAEKALNIGLTEERAKEQICKTGGTPFEFEQLSIYLDEDMVLPVKELNSLRRKALEELECKRVIGFKRESEQIFVSSKCQDEKKFICLKQDNKQISVLFYKLDNEQELKKLINLNIRRLYLPFNFFLNNLKRSEEDIALKNLIELLKQNNIEVFVWLPSITRGNYDVLIKKNITNLTELGITGILTGNLGTLEYASQFPTIKLACDYSFNIFNSNSAEILYNLGAECLTFSYELNLEQIKNISHLLRNKGIEVDKEVLVYGRVPLMTSEYCPVGALNDGEPTKASYNNAIIQGAYSNRTCSNRNCTMAVYSLQDRMKEHFPIHCDNIDCRTTILNSKILFLADNMNKITSSGADIFRINVWNESIDEVKNLVKMHQDLVKDNFEDGLTKYNDEIKKIKDKGFTRGHYFRGV